MESLALIFAAMTVTFELPPGLNSAVCFVESSHVTSVVHTNDGGSDSIGVCQIKLATARLLGFKGSAKALRNPHTNIHYASKYLHSQLRRYHGDIYKAVSAYNAGTHRMRESGLACNHKYVTKVFQAWGEEK